MPITIIIADDHPIFRKGLADTIASNSEFEIVGQANNGNEALKLIITLKPDIALLDINMPELTGLDVAAKALANSTTTKFIILTLHKEVNYYLKALQIGVMGYVLKDDAIASIKACIEAVAKGEAFISKEFKNVNEANEKSPIEKYKLTATELIILKLVAQGKSSNEISDVLFISPKTIDNHRSNITKKIGLEGKNALVKFTLQNKEWFLD
jgi:DNA-binding NarL/FixJ family response regulator